MAQFMLIPVGHPVSGGSAYVKGSGIRGASESCRSASRPQSIQQPRPLPDPLARFW